MDYRIFRKSIDVLGRICLTAVFINAVPIKITKFSYVVSTITDRGIPGSLGKILLLAAIILLVLGSLILIIGEDQKLGASLLLIFLIPTTIIFHLFPFQPQVVFLNLSLIGGLTLALTRSKFIE